MTDVTPGAAGAPPAVLWRAPGPPPFSPRTGVRGRGYDNNDRD